MDVYRPYVDRLDSLVIEALQAPELLRSSAELASALDGQPAEQLRQLVTVDEMRQSGAFFTNLRLARAMLRGFIDTIDQNSVIIDPTCGAGDLLLRCAPHLPRGANLKETIDLWGQYLIGCDIHPEFVTATKSRLLLAAINTGVPVEAFEAENRSSMFSKIVEHDFLADPTKIHTATHIVINPPFGRTDAPANCQWGSGKVSAAALFLEACIQHAQPGARIVAILPDVLRSGSNYEKWRKVVEARTHEERVELCGLFDKLTDVDVFIIELVIQSNPKPTLTPRWKQHNNLAEKSVGDYFEIRVGPVVNYRDPHEGAKYPFITTGNLPPWKKVTQASEVRRFKGRVFDPPFVVVRRTSRRGDEHRAVATLINLDSSSVAVENHLLVLLPNDGSIERCEELLRVLQNPKTTTWLDQRIRCRHLTVSSLRDVPWEDISK